MNKILTIILLLFAVTWLNACLTYFDDIVADNCETPISEEVLLVHFFIYDHQNPPYLFLTASKRSDTIQSVYLSKANMILPLGRTIDLMDKNMQMKTFDKGDFSPPSMAKHLAQNITPQYINGTKAVDMGTYAAAHTVAIYFDIDVPFYVNKVRIDYTIVVELENGRTVEQRCSIPYKRKYVPYLFIWLGPAV